MKTLKVSIVALATLVFGAVIFISCSNEESTVTPDNSLMNYRITDETAFLSEFYNDSWTTGKSATVSDSLNTYNVTEIIVGTDTRARGYLVKDDNTGELLYFADVDRTNYVLKTVDLITEETETFEQIDRHPDYSLSGGFDFIKIIIDNNPQPSPTGRFWGWTCGPTWSTLPNDGDCWRTCCYYIIWRKNHCVEVPCNELPGSNPKMISVTPN
jgi:hypothetical protein